MNIEDRIIRVVSETLGSHRGPIVDQSTAEDLGMDSLDAVEVIMAIELEFNLEIPDKYCEPIKGIQQLIDYVNTCLA